MVAPIRTASWIGWRSSSSSRASPPPQRRRCAPGRSVSEVHRAEDGYRILSDAGEICCRALVLATGANNAPRVPDVAQALPPTVHSVPAFDYRNPEQLPPGGVLVVGASATGVQLADEIHRAGRPVTLCVGEHVRLPQKLSRPRQPLVDGALRGLEPALR